MGRAAVDVMHHHQLHRWGLPADLLQQLPLQGLLRRFTGIEVPPDSPQQPAAIPMQHGQGYFNGHGASSSRSSAEPLLGVDRCTAGR